MFQIRKPAVSDAAGIAACHFAAVWTKAAERYSEDVLREWSPEPTSQRIAEFSKEIADQSLIYRVAFVEDEILGFGIIIPATKEFRALYVRPNSIGKIGAALCFELLHAARRLGATELFLDSSLNAVGFYSSMGAKSLGGSDHLLASGSVMPCVKMQFNLLSSL
jgi:predicted N-acetyltransferase YhbS